MKSIRWYGILLLGLVLLISIPFSGCATAYTIGDLNSAYQQGYDAGFEAGFNSANQDVRFSYQDGYDDGYADGIAQHEQNSNIRQEPGQQNGLVEAQVTRIIDGDTIEVDIQGKTHIVRYIGIDTPEVGSPCADAATEANRELVEGEIVQLEKDVSETDMYDRLLRYVHIGDTVINAELVKQGYARPVSYPPDTKYDDILWDAAFFPRIVDALGIWSEPCFLTYTNLNNCYTIKYPQSWEILDESENRLILFSDTGFNSLIVEVSHFDDSIEETAEFYLDFLHDTYSDMWSDITVTNSQQVTGKWDWQIDFTFTDIVSPSEPKEGIGQAFIIQAAENLSFIVQWDGSDVLSEECQRIVNTFNVQTPCGGGSSSSAQDSTTNRFVGSLNSDIYHYPSCYWANQIYPQNEIWFSSSNDARAHGYRPCKVCRPP